MRYFWRVFLWENGRHSTEYTKYVNAPIFLEDKLDETLDGGEIILMGMPIESKAAFPPKTKFRLERYLSKDYSDEPKKWDLIVEHDDVEEYTGCPDLCTHRVHLIEASAVAQGMHVDNIALTYELQDVDLNYKVTKDDNTIIGNGVAVTPGGGSYEVSRCDDPVWPLDNQELYFENSYRYVWDRLEDIQKLQRYYNGSQIHEIVFTVPRLMCQGYRSSGWDNLFEMNTETIVRRKKLLNDKDVETVDLIHLYSGPIAIPVCDDDLYYSTGGTAAITSCITGSKKVTDEMLNSGKGYFRASDCRIHLPVVASVNLDYYNKTIRFNTQVLSETELEQGYIYQYEIDCRAKPTNKEGMIEHYKTMVAFDWDRVPDYYFLYSEQDKKICSSESVSVVASFLCASNDEDVSGGMFLAKGAKYCCYDLLQKAMLTIDTQIINNATVGLDDLQDNYSIIVSDSWTSYLKETKMQETMFEQKNLWELLIQIGYYLHAIPYLEFAEDGTDRFVLAFRQLGDTRMRADTNTKITVFNSRNLSEYFTQYDSYVTNLFSPQNEVDEWLVPKTNDSTYLVSNNTAELHTSRQIVEITAFDITYNGQTVSALSYIFEESIYQILTSDNPIRIKPAKGNSLYYRVGTNVIGGLNYVPPQNNDGTYKLALQEICRRLFKTDEKLKFNDLMFHIRYRTQDDMRLSQVRPDIQNFVRNSAYEKYPHHEQYYGQQDKIIDSERFSANLFGKLIRVGNAVYQRQEFVQNAGDEKNSGDLVEIGGDMYYVMATENEYYQEAILQKVTYSKNFNQLSNIVTIPSEPRFYEVSERSKIRREVRLMEFLELSTIEPTQAVAPRYLSNVTWKEFISAIIFNKAKVTLPNFAYTRFSADYRRIHKGGAGQIISPDDLFPSSEVERAGENNIRPKGSKGYSECIVSLMHFPLHDGIIFEWDMEDNFKVGDYIDREVNSETNDVNEAYMAQQSHRYVDVMGRADLFTFRLFHKTDWTHEQAQRLPMAVITPSESDCIAYLPAPYTIGLDKDNREELSFNYQINLLHRPSEDDSEDFVTFPNLFGQKESPLKMCFLNEPQSLFNENVSMTTASMVADDVPYSLIENTVKNAIEVRITRPEGVNLNNVKAIVLYQADSLGGKYAYIVKNVHKLLNERKLQSWWIFPVFSS